MDDLSEELVMISRTLPDTVSMETCETINKAADRIEKLERALTIYEAERNRFKHAHPEMTGAYYLAGGHGNKDQNMLPEYVEIVPAYGCAWSQIYQKTERTISMEGS